VSEPLRDQGGRRRVAREGETIGGRDTMDSIATAMLGHRRHDNRVVETRNKGELPFQSIGG
jgi:hypothetical protein